MASVRRWSALACVRAARDPRAIAPGSRPAAPHLGREPHQAHAAAHELERASARTVPRPAADCARSPPAPRPAHVTLAATDTREHPAHSQTVGKAPGEHPLGEQRRRPPARVSLPSSARKPPSAPRRISQARCQKRLSVRPRPSRRRAGEGIPSQRIPSPGGAAATSRDESRAPRIISRARSR